MPMLPYGDPVIIGYVVIMVCFGVGLTGAILWIWMIVDCATKEPSEGNKKLFWIPIIVLIPGIGALFYFVGRRQERIHEFGR